MPNEEIEKRLQERLAVKAAEEADEKARESYGRAYVQGLAKKTIPRLEEIEWNLLTQIKREFEPYLNGYGLSCSVLRRGSVPKGTTAENLREIWRRARGKIEQWQDDNDAFSSWYNWNKPELIFHLDGINERIRILVYSPWGRFSEIPENPDLSRIGYHGFEQGLEKTKDDEGYEVFFGKTWTDLKGRDSSFESKDQVLEYLKKRLVECLEIRHQKRSQSLLGRFLG